MGAGEEGVRPRPVAVRPGRRPKTSERLAMTYRLDPDRAHVYGPAWAFWYDEGPFSVVLAEGSDVRVCWRSSLRGRRTSEPLL